MVTFLLPLSDNGPQDDQVLIRCIRACANGLLLEQPQKRVQLADNMLEKLKGSGIYIYIIPSSCNVSFFILLDISLSVKVKNSLLQVYLQNHHKFSPSSFLQNMKVPIV